MTSTFIPSTFTSSTITQASFSPDFVSRALLTLDTDVDYIIQLVTPPPSVRKPISPPTYVSWGSPPRFPEARSVRRR